MLRTRGILVYDKNHKMGDPCGGYISDHEFLKHMIPHHQVAIDMSKEVMKYSRDPNIVYLARNIIFSQTDEILFMEGMFLSHIPNVSSNDKYRYKNPFNKFALIFPNKSRAKNYKCGLHHFSSKMAKMHKLKPGEIFTDEQYMNGMIHHHDVAIEMSDRVLKHSKNPTMRTFANDIIKNQRYEIWLMRNYLKHSQKQCSPFFVDKHQNKSNFVGIESFGINYNFTIIILLMIILLYFL
jgi:uncharacterized protein (DUF305 family)